MAKYEKIDSIKVSDIQEKYGTPLVIPQKITFEQEAYGVPISTVQPAYGVVTVPPISTVQPAYGVITVPTDINITYDQLEDMITNLRKSINTMKDTWNGGTRQNIAKLESSWVGKDCVAYTEKLNKMHSKVQKTIQALELLCNTYEKARDMVKDSQDKTSAAINNY